MPRIENIERIKAAVKESLGVAKRRLGLEPPRRPTPREAIDDAIFEFWTGDYPPGTIFWTISKEEKEILKRDRLEQERLSQQDQLPNDNTGQNP